MEIFNSKVKRHTVLDTIHTTSVNLNSYFGFINKVNGEILKSLVLKFFKNLFTAIKEINIRNLYVNISNIFALL